VIGLTPQLEWMASAACLTTEPELFFPQGHNQNQWSEEAKDVCRACPVRNQCLERALSIPEEYGIFGGLDADERRRLARNNARKSRAKEATA